MPRRCRACELARPGSGRNPARARRPASHACRLGLQAPRPRRPRLRRPARLHRRQPARRQPGASTGGRGRRARHPQRVRPPGGGRGRRALAREREPRPADGRGRAPGRPARDHLDVPAAARSSSTRRTSTRRCASATGGSTSGASSCSGTSACARRLVSIIRRGDGGGRVRRSSRRRSWRKPTPEGARDFLVPTAAPEGPLLRASAVAADLQAAARSSAASSATTRSLAASGTRTCAPIALQELTQLDVEMAFPDREYIFELIEKIVLAIWRETHRRRAAESPFPRMSYAGGDAPLRLGQARPALRARDPGRDRGHARLASSRSSRARRPSGILTRAAGVLARRPREARGRSPRSGGRRGSPTSSSARTESRRSPIAKFLSEEELAGVPRRSGDDGALRRRRARQLVAQRARRAAPATSAASSG